MTISRRVAAGLSVAYVLSLFLVAAAVPSMNDRDGLMSGAEAFRFSARAMLHFNEVEDVESVILALAWLANLPLIATLVAGLSRRPVGRRLLIALLVGIVLAGAVFFAEARPLRVAYYLWFAILCVEAGVVWRGWQAQRR